MTGKVTCVYPASASLTDNLRALATFTAQTYPHKQLLIAGCGRDWWSNAVGKIDPTLDVIFCESEPGAAANLPAQSALPFASGQFICNWSPDCWHHRRRLELQVAHLLRSGKAASCATYTILFDAHGYRLYMSGRQLWPTSLLCLRDYLADYPELFQAGDASLASVEAHYGPHLNAIAPHAFAFLSIQRVHAAPGDARSNDYLRSALPLPQAHCKVIAPAFTGSGSCTEIAAVVDNRNFLGSLPYTLRRGETLL